MLSQLIVVDFTKGTFPVVYDELTRAYDRVVSFCHIETHEAFELHLFNYDKSYTAKPDIRLVFILDHEPVKDEPPNPLVSVIDKAYRDALSVKLFMVTHSEQYTHCQYQCENPPESYPVDFKFLEGIIT